MSSYFVTKRQKNAIKKQGENKKLKNKVSKKYNYICNTNTNKVSNYFLFFAAANVRTFIQKETTAPLENGRSRLVAFGIPVDQAKELVAIMQANALRIEWRGDKA
jgi:hypothetical protein